MSNVIQLNRQQGLKPTQPTSTTYKVYFVTYLMQRVCKHRPEIDGEIYHLTATLHALDGNRALQQGEALKGYTLNGDIVKGVLYAKQATA